MKYWLRTLSAVCFGIGMAFVLSSQLESIGAGLLTASVNFFMLFLEELK